LAFLYQLLTDHPNVIIEIQGHSDCTEKDFDKKLSQKRAQVCVDYLVSKGIPQERLVAKGYGVEIPRIYNLDCESIKKLPTKEEQEIAHQKNRRVQFRVLSFDYKPTDN
jgi:peptidoglycan-associated lipoprotein